jgi:hypothetical protein
VQSSRRSPGEARRSRQKAKGGAGGGGISSIGISLVPRADRENEPTWPRNRCEDRWRRFERLRIRTSGVGFRVHWRQARNRYGILDLQFVACRLEESPLGDVLGRGLDHQKRSAPGIKLDQHRRFARVAGREPQVDEGKSQMKQIAGTHDLDCRRKKPRNKKPIDVQPRQRHALQRQLDPRHQCVSHVGALGLTETLAASDASA